MSVFTRRFLLAFAAFGLLAAFGTVGYMVVEGWAFADAAYMSVITITAVGYEEVRPLTDRGRTFTMILLGGGVTWMGVWFALITSLIVESDLKHLFRRRRVKKEVDNIEGHVVVCGAGRTGRQVAEELEAMKTRVVVVEKDPAQAEAFRGAHPDGLVLEGDATHDLTLLQAGLDRARGLVACLSADTDNLFVCLSARDLKPDLTIVVRAYEEETMDKLYRAGATHVVSPNVSGAIRMASVLLRPSVVSFLDIATRSSDLSLRMEQVEIPTTSTLAGRSLAEARIPQETGLIVIAMREPRATGGGGFVFNPAAATTMDPGDELIVLGTVEQIGLLRNYVGI
ncbi:MAG: potassium channel protein [Gemmatimonadetes bacterium]|nr:potassium channel protein [Gemmatimonadota bacterium]